eukprot:230952-Hanusia_phi.AAC.2
MRLKEEKESTAEQGGSAGGSEQRNYERKKDRGKGKLKWRIPEFEAETRGRKGGDQSGEKGSRWEGK